MSKDRADRLKDRRRRRHDDTDEEASSDGDSPESSKTSEDSGASNTSESSQQSQSSKRNETPVRDQTHVAMYLREELAEELDLRFDELNLEYRQEYGEKMTKSGEFYPALARAAINDTTVREELGLTDE